MNTKSRNQPVLCLILLALLALAACTGTGPAEGATVETITLERQPCFGFCPIYTVALHGDGTVEYNGIEYVEVSGTQTGAVDPATVQTLADEMVAAGYLDWEDEYANQEVTDHAYVVSSITFSDGTTKTIRHYLGDASAPKELTAIEDQIDLTANTAQWIGEPQQE